MADYIYHGGLELIFESLEILSVAQENKYLSVWPKMVHEVPDLTLDHKVPVLTLTGGRIQRTSLHRVFYHHPYSVSL